MVGSGGRGGQQQRRKQVAKFTKSDRQRIIDDYLAASGQNMFHAGVFIDWLADNPDHEAHPWFFGKDDEDAAREYRIGLARQMASGLRITAQVSVAPEKGSVVSFKVREYPAYISPIEGRHGGGGYFPTDPEDEAHLAEIRRQGATALRSWLRRYGGAMEESGIDISALVELASDIDSRKVQSA